MYGTEGREFSLAAAGDAIITRRMSVHDGGRFERLVEAIRQADASVVNLEVMLHDFESPPAAQSGGTWMRAPPWVADELSWMGFDAFSAATNHVGDYSIGGMETTMRALEEREIPYAGLGRNLAAAREPAYVDTPAGRVALVSTCSTMTAGSRAGEQRRDMQGRPGLSPLRLDTRFVVRPETFERVRELSAELGLDDAKASLREVGSRMFDAEDDETFVFFDPGGSHTGDTLRFEVGDDPGVRQEPAERDREAVLRAIDAADRQADWVVATLHAHEGVNGRVNEESVPPFIEAFARDCVDAGADAFVGHGPHVVSGIELYDGAPILYSLGNFVEQTETVSKLPAEIYEGWELPDDSLPADLFDERIYDDGEPTGDLAKRENWESVLPVCRFDGDGLEGIELLPVDLGRTEARPRRGRPVLAEDDTAERVVERLADLSAPYGTEVAFEDGIGHVKP